MFSNGRFKAPRVGGPGGSFQTVPRRNTKTTDRNTNTYCRVVEKVGGSEKAGKMLRTYRALVDNRKPVGCVHDTADGLLISLIQLGYSEWFFNVGGYKLERIRKEMKDPAL